jgi:hypothetical protein
VESARQRQRGAGRERVYGESCDQVSSLVAGCCRARDAGPVQGIRAEIEHAVASGENLIWPGAPTPLAVCAHPAVARGQSTGPGWQPPERALLGRWRWTRRSARVPNGQFRGATGRNGPSATIRGVDQGHGAVLIAAASAAVSASTRKCMRAGCRGRVLGPDGRCDGARAQTASGATTADTMTRTTRTEMSSLFGFALQRRGLVAAALHALCTHSAHGYS